MKGIKSFFTGFGIGLAVIACACVIEQGVYYAKIKNMHVQFHVPETNFGRFLAGHHALYVNDFAAADRLFRGIDEDNIYLVKQNKILSSFFNGNMPSNVEDLKANKDLSSRLIYDAHLIQQNDWKNLYSRHIKDDSLLIAPLRIFAGVKQGKTKEVLKFVDSLKTSDAWKSFVRGQIAVLNNDIDTAAKEFANVQPEYMNINDYLYLMSFYRENNMTEDMEILRDDFTAFPSGVYVIDYPEIPDWSRYSGYENHLIFSIIQTISHTQVMIFTDLSLMLLRFADVISESGDKDAINYYLGQYYFFNNGDYKSSFENVSKKHPLYVFGQMKITEKDGDLDGIKKISRQHPLFLPATNIAIANEIKYGNKNAALKIVNRALKHKDLTDNAKKYLLKKRANIYLMFKNPKKAQKDLDTVLEMDTRMLKDVLLLQARIWEQQNKNLNEAYNYAMTLVKRNTSDILGWDILGVIVDKNEGVDAGLDILERVSHVGALKSCLMEHLGDLYNKKGDKAKARAAYERAIELGDDGFIVVPYVQKKIRKLK